MKCCLFIFVLAITTIAAPIGPEIKHIENKGTYESIARGVGYLLSKQQADGSWVGHPAITALCVIAIYDRSTADVKKNEFAIEAGLNFIRQHIQPDGSIWSKKAKEYPNYTTAISLLALAVVNRPEDFLTIRNAREYLIGSQFNDSKKIDFGGIGYGKTGRADLSNLSWTAEAIYQTDYLDSEAFNKDIKSRNENRKVWEKIRVFISNCQNLAETNTQSWVSNRKEDFGGFVYRPNESKAGEAMDSSTGKNSLLSSGSMTYAGLKSMIYAKMDKKDVRVQAAIDYVLKNYTLKENPGMGLQGLYFYLNVMAKAFSAYGENELKDADGNFRAWRKDMLEEIQRLQKKDGRWENVNGRYMESIPELATAYTITTARIALGKTQSNTKPSP